MRQAGRILRALGVKPRRTIRVVLWSAEEKGWVGSKAYVEKHFGDPTKMILKPEHTKLAGHFNFDYGSGRIRGVYAQTNVAVKPIFEEWLKPFHDLGATDVVIRDTRGRTTAPSTTSVYRPFSSSRTRSTKGRASTTQTWTSSTT